MIQLACNFFDELNKRWESTSSSAWQSNILVAVFLFSMSFGLSNMYGLTDSVPLLGNIRPLDAIRYSFNFLLFFEMITLAFTFAQSTSKAIAKQFQIMSLIFLRTSFEELAHWSVHSTFEEQVQTILRMSSDALAAIIIFLLVYWFYKYRSERQIADEDRRLRFIRFKKIISLFVLGALMFIVTHDFLLYLKSGKFIPSYTSFYMALIFADMLMMLVALRYVTHYPNIFRYSAYVLITIFIRMALMAPVYINAIIGISTVLFGIGVTLIHRTYIESIQQKNIDGKPDSSSLHPKQL